MHNDINNALSTNTFPFNKRFFTRGKDAYYMDRLIVDVRFLLRVLLQTFIKIPNKMVFPLLRFESSRSKI